MKTFKRIDYLVQVTLISLSIMYGLYVRDARCLTGYYITGGWQVLSYLTHLFFKHNYYPGRKRKAYGNILLFMIGLGVFLLAIYPAALIMFFLILLFGSPILAIWYSLICYTENETLKYRSLVHLK